MKASWSVLTLSLNIRPNDQTADEKYLTLHRSACIYTNVYYIYFVENRRGSLFKILKFSYCDVACVIEVVWLLMPSSYPVGASSPLCQKVLASMPNLSSVLRDCQ